MFRREVKMRFSNSEKINMLLIYGACDGNAKRVSQTYAEISWTKLAISMDVPNISNIRIFRQSLQSCKILGITFYKALCIFIQNSTFFQILTFTNMTFYLKKLSWLWNLRDASTEKYIYHTIIIHTLRNVSRNYTTFVYNNFW